MALDPTTIAKAFKDLGKLIHVAKTFPADATSFKTIAVATVDQMISGEASELTILDTIAQPAKTQMNVVATGIDNLASQAKAAVDTYLRTVLPSQMGVASGTATAMATELAAQMTTEVESVAIDGEFYVFFNTNYGVELPTDEAPTVTDAWIAAGVVAA